MDISKLKKKGKKHVGNYIGHNPTTINSLLYDLLALRNITLITIIILSFLDLAQLLRGALNPSATFAGNRLKRFYSRRELDADREEVSNTIRVSNGENDGDGGNLEEANEDRDGVGIENMDILT